MLALLVFALCLSPFLAAVSDNPCVHNKGIRWLKDDHDCKIFYICYESNPSKYHCPNGTVTDTRSKSCVPKGSPLDTCTAAPSSGKTTVTTPTDTTSMPLTKTTIQTPTQAPTKLPINICNSSSQKHVPHPTNCAKYVDCTNGSPIARECPYPMLFNDKSGDCSHIDQVTCLGKYKPLSPCDYHANQCKTSHCVPCSVRYPSCVGLPDGPNPWTGRLWSPFFIVCYKERVVFQGQCTFDGPSEVFDPTNRKCIDITNRGS